MSDSAPDNPYRASSVEHPAAPRPDSSSSERLQFLMSPVLGEWDDYWRWLVWGERFYGQCDQVPGTLHVLTRFFHLWWFPLVPRESWLVLLDGHDCPSACHVRMRLQVKSIALAWTRALLWVAAAVLGCAGIGGLLLVAWERHDPTDPFLLVGGAVAIFAVLRLARRLETAGPARRLGLLHLAGFTQGEAQWIVDAIDRGELAEGGLAGVKCGHCGRELAATTRICPRCEQRVN